MCVDGDAEVVSPDDSRLNTGLWLCAECADQEEVETECVCASVLTVGAVWVCATDARVTPVAVAMVLAPEATEEVCVWLCPPLDVSEYVCAAKVMVPSDAVAE